MQHTMLDIKKLDVYVYCAHSSRKLGNVHASETIIFKKNLDDILYTKLSQIRRVGQKHL